MNPQQIQQFCRRYFLATGCTLLKEEPEYMEVELTLDVDKELTDRPYYWMWVEASGEEVKPTVLHLAFTPDTKVEGIKAAERVTLGSFRLNKLFESVKKRGRLTRQFQAQQEGRLEPYFLVSGKLSFLADRRRDEIVSYGIHLHTESIISDFFTAIRHLPMSSRLPVGCTLQPSRLSYREAWELIRQKIAADLDVRDHEWAEEAKQHLAEEMEQLETYYGSLIAENEEERTVFTAEKQLRLAELQWRYQPRIEFVPFHMGLFYLAHGFRQSPTR